MAEKVAILGGGVAGLSAAHELIERGFDVSVYELNDVPGGKARSIAAPHTGSMQNVGTVHVGRAPAERRSDLPGEHGFRFFPRFYRHIVDTMQRIPYGDKSTVADNLVDTHDVLITRFGRRGFNVPARFPRSPHDLKTLFDDIVVVCSPELGVPWGEKLYFVERIWQIMTSCKERREQEYEKLPWWDFVGASERSLDYQRFFALGITRSLVAARAETASTRTIGTIFVQLLLDIATPGISSDRVLNGPTNEVWIDPWLRHLESRGLQYDFDSRVRSLHVRDGLITRAVVEQHRRLVDVRADYYVAALPVEVMAGLITPELIEAAPELGNILPLSRSTEWMNGIQFYLTEDVPIVRGHVLCVDSPWAITAISQRQFWPGYDPNRHGNGRIRGIISVDISNWDAPGFGGKPARECNREELRHETWEQLKASLNVAGQDLLRDEALYDWFLDPAINPLLHSNGEPLLVNQVDTLRLRPDAVTSIPNLFLASDYVRTYTDLATMEGANEAARRAVNGILQRSGVRASPCQLWELQEPLFLEPLRAHDRLRFEQGQPWDDTLTRIVFSLLQMAQQLIPALGPGTPVGEAVLASLTERYPTLRDLRIQPEVLKSLMGGNGEDLATLLLRIVPLVADQAPEIVRRLEQLPRLSELARDGLRSAAVGLAGRPGASPSGTNAGPAEEAEPPRAAEPISARPVAPSATGGSLIGGVRFFQP